MAMYKFNIPENAMAKVLGPAAVDSRIQEAILFTWLMLPEDKKSIETLEAEVRRTVDRAFRNLRQDARSFGIQDL